MEPALETADELLAGLDDMGKILRKMADCLGMDLDSEVRVLTGVDIERAEGAGRVKQTREYR